MYIHTCICVYIYIYIYICISWSVTEVARLVPPGSYSQARSVSGAACSLPISISTLKNKSAVILASPLCLGPCIQFSDTAVDSYYEVLQSAIILASREPDVKQTTKGILIEILINDRHKQ